MESFSITFILAMMCSLMVATLHDHLVTSPAMFKKIETIYPHMISRLQDVEKEVQLLRNQHNQQQATISELQRETLQLKKRLEAKNDVEAYANGPTKKGLEKLSLKNSEKETYRRISQNTEQGIRGNLPLLDEVILMRKHNSRILKNMTLHECKENHVELQICLNRFLEDITWELIDIENINLIDSQSYGPDESGLVQSSEHCITDGFYLFSLYDSYGDGIQSQESVNNACSKIYVNGDTIIDGFDSFSQELHYVITIIDGTTSISNPDNLCSEKPSLLPVNHLNGFVYDDRVAKMIDIFHSLSSTRTLIDYNTPQYKAACYLLFDDKEQLTAEDKILKEKYVICVFFFSTHQHVERTFRWNHCEANGVKCEVNGHIIALEMNNDFLKGSLPPELSHLHYLEHMDFHRNRLTGTIPTELGRLFNLKLLYLSYNYLIGTIPSEIGRLQKLEDLWVGNNERLSGSMPTEIGRCTSLKIFDIGYSLITGSIPSELFDATGLDQLYLHNNLLTGTIPETIGRLHNLHLFHVQRNRLNGTIPTELYMPSMEDISLFQNQFSGTLPSELGYCSSLQNLQIFENQFKGSLPDVFQNFTKLVKIYVNNNRFTGMIPNSLWNVGSLKSLKLQRNELSGNAPSDICERLKDFIVDDSTWFMEEPKVECNCCKDRKFCYVWDQTRNVDIPCPKSNIVQFSEDFEIIPSYIKDLHAHEVLFNPDRVKGVRSNDTFGVSTISNPYSICLSPTGCYEVIDIQKNLYLGYSGAVRGVVEGNETHSCDAVEICDMIIDSNDPRRKILNYITMTTVSDISTFLDDTSSPQYKALCWMLSEDQNSAFYNDINSCAHGSILQRYVMAIFIISTGHLNRTENGNEFALNETCEWDGVVCSPNKIIQEINFHDKELNGTLITEIGYLSSLKKLDLSSNKFTGSIDPSIFRNMSNLEIFDVGDNIFEGSIIEGILTRPILKIINVSNNFFDESLPSDIQYSTTLEYFDAANNLLNGPIPEALTECAELRLIDLSQNNFDGRIITQFGLLKNLHTLRFNENDLTGIIPTQLFSLYNMSIMMLHSNSLTGGIPTFVGSLKKITSITLNHNRLKGTIPEELVGLSELKILHLHQNQLTGRAPILKKIEDFSFITDCGFPSYALPANLKCESCTMCCNSEDSCQEVITTLSISIWGCALIICLVMPFGLTVFLFLVTKVAGVSFVPEEGLDLSRSYTEDSTYSLILSSDRRARLIFVLTIIIQIALFYVYLLASEFDKEITDWQFSFQCPENSTNCKSLNYVNTFGWTMFGLVLHLFLGRDVIISTRQIYHAVIRYDWSIGLSGFFLLFISLLAATTTITYNVAFSVKNTDLIMNAVILLFVNDLDERVLSVCEVLMPEWADLVKNEVAIKMSHNKTIRDDSEIEREIREIEREITVDTKIDKSEQKNPNMWGFFIN